MNRRNILAAGAAGLGLAGFSHSAVAKVRIGTPSPSIEEVLFDPDIPVLGNSDGDVTVVEYFDYQCPYCKAHHAEILQAVLDDGNARLVKKDWPIFGAVSRYAARLVLAAEDPAMYRAAMSALMATEGQLSEDYIGTVLGQSGVGAAALEESYRRQAGRIDAVLERNEAQAHAFQFSGTPSFIVESTVYPGVMTGRAIAEAIKLVRK